MPHKDRRGLRVVGPDEPVPEPRPGWPPFVAQWVLPYMQEPSLWPVAVAVLGHVVIVIVPLILALARTGSPWAAVCLLLVGAATALPVRWEIAAEGRPRVATAVVVAIWATSAITAWASDRYALL